MLRENRLTGYWGFLLLLTLAGPVQAAKIAEGVSFPDTVEIKKKKLLLNGTGLRTATIFKVRVYAAGLYLPQKTTDDSSVLSSKEPKQVRLVFLRDIDEEDIKKSWKKSFDKNCEPDCDAFKGTLDQLLGWVSAVKVGDSMSYSFTDKGVSLSINDQLKGSIENPKFARALLSMWIGPHPPNEKLKQGLMGTLN